MSHGIFQGYLSKISFILDYYRPISEVKEKAKSECQRRSFKVHTFKKAKTCNCNDPFAILRCPKHALENYSLSNHHSEQTAKTTPNFVTNKSWTQFGQLPCKCGMRSARSNLAVHST